MQERRLIVGLGNPGKEYANTRHNIGQMAVDHLAQLAQADSAWSKKFDGQIVEYGDCQGARVLLFKPGTYMNNSGIPLAAAARFFKVTAENITVIHDDIDLALGKIRVKNGGGHGGHNGLRSIDTALGTPKYWRIRLGVGRPVESGEVATHVLSKFRTTELLEVERMCGFVASSMKAICTHSWEQIISKIPAFSSAVQS